MLAHTKRHRFCVNNSVLEFIQVHNFKFFKEVFETEEGKEILKKCNIEGDYEGIGFCILGYSDIQIKNELPRKDNFVYYLK